MSFIKVQGVNPPSTRPRVDLIDSVLPDAGALLLIDPTHPAGTWAAGVPGHLGVIPNIASASSSLLTGGPSNGFIEIGSTAPSWLAQERTSKGGLHAIAKNLAGMATTSYYRMTVDNSLKQYIFDHLENDFYFSQWTRGTRQSSGSGTPMFTSAYAASSSQYYADLYRLTTGNETYPNGSTFGAAETLGRRVGASAAGSAALTNVGVNSWVGSNPGTYNVIWTLPMMSGATGPAPMSTSYVPPSYVFYRAYVEDLTVSGRTYAEVDALDNAEFIRQCNTAGGRYFGDTYMDPAAAVFA